MAFDGVQGKLHEMDSEAPLANIVMFLSFLCTCEHGEPLKVYELDVSQKLRVNLYLYNYII